MGTNRLQNVSLPDNSLKGGGGFTFSDADTLIDSNNNTLRIEGLEVAEKTRILQKDRDLTLLPGTAGGDMANLVIPKFANEKGLQM